MRLGRLGKTIVATSVVELFTKGLQVLTATIRASSNHGYGMEGLVMWYSGF